MAWSNFYSIRQLNSRIQLWKIDNFQFSLSLLFRYFLYMHVWDCNTSWCHIANVTSHSLYSLYYCSFPTESKVWCSMRNAKLVIGATYVIVPIICFPVYLTFAIHHDNYPGRNRYFVNYSDISLKNDGLLKNINFWVFSVGLKLVPCILLTYLSIALIRLLMEAERRRQRLKASNLRGHIGSAQNVSIASDPARKPERQQSLIDSRKGSEESQVDLPTKEVIPGNPDEGATTSSSPPPRSTSGEHLIGSQVTPTPKSNNNNNTLRVSTHVGDFSSSTTGTSHSVQHTQPSSHHHSITTTTFNHHHHHSSQSDRTTKMLVAILLLFLVTEFPSGTVALLSGFLGESFHMNVYQPLGEIFDILALINSGINFILYCVMSRLFRKTFCKIFWPQKYRRDLSLRRFTQQNQNQIQSHLHLRPLTQNLTARPPTIGPLPPPPGIKCTSPSSVGFNHVEGKTFFPVEGNGSQSPTSQASIRMNQTTATTVNSRNRDVQSPVVVTQVVDRNHPFISKNCDFELPLCSTNSTSPKCPMSSPTETGDIISSSPNVTTTTVVWVSMKHKWPRQSSAHTSVTKRKQSTINHTQPDIHSWLSISPLINHHFVDVLILCWKEKWQFA